MVSPVRKISYLEEMDKMPAFSWLRIKPKAPNTTKMWFEDANCYNMDSEIFEPALEGGSRQENLELSEARLEQARKACSDCPVWHLCYAKGQENDFYYTTRAGLEPGQLTEYKDLGRVNYRSGQEVERCINGHNDWVIWGKKKPRKKCRECARLDGVRKSEAKRATLEA